MALMMERWKIDTIGAAAARIRFGCSLWSVRPGLKVDNRGRIQRLNAIRSRLLEEARGEYICYLDGDDFYTDPNKLQKQADILDADKEHVYVACGHNGCYYWESTGETRPIEKPIRECGLTAKEYWSFLYVHTNAMMFRNLRQQGIDPYASRVTIDDNMLTAQFLPYGGVYYLPDCMFNYRQTEGSTFICAVSTRTLCSMH